MVQDGAKVYGEFQRARFERSLQPRAAQKDDIAANAANYLPAMNTDHMIRMTDDTGILQHAIFSCQTRARAIQPTTTRARSLCQFIWMKTRACGRHEYAHLSHRYLSFLWLAFHSDSGRFRNFLDYDRKWLEDVGSDDSHGRALWSLGMCWAIREMQD